MALQKQTVPIIFRGGFDTKADEPSQAPQNVRLALNVLFDDANTLALRNGQRKVTNPAGLTENISRAFTVRGSPVVETVNGNMLPVGKDSLPARSQLGFGQNEAWSVYPKQFPRAAVLTRRVVGVQRAKEPIPAASSQGWNYDIAESPTSNSYCVVYEMPGAQTVNSGIQMTIKDKLTDTVLRSFLIESSTAHYLKPRVVYCPASDKYMVFLAVVNSATPKLYSVSGFLYAADGSGATLPTFVGPFITTAAGASNVESPATPSTYVKYDVSPLSSDGLRFTVAGFSTDGLNTLSAVQIDQSGTVQYTFATVTAATAPASVGAFTYWTGAVWTSAVVYGAGQFVRGRVGNSGGAFAAEATLLDNGAGNLAGRVTITSSGSTFLVASDVLTVPSGVIAQAVVDINVITATLGLVTSFASQTPQVGYQLAGRFVTYGTRLCLPAARQAVPSATSGGACLLFDITPFVGVSLFQVPHVIARLEVYNAWRIPAQDYTRRVPACLSASFTFLKYDTDLILTAGNVETPLSIVSADIDMTGQLGYIETNGVTFLAGACPLITDGETVFEEGFNGVPEVLGTTAAAAASGSVSWTGPGVGTTSFCFTESYQDSQGNWYESAPSSIVTVTTTAINNVVNFSVARVPSLKPSNRRRLMMYRTLVSSTDPNFYLAQNEGGGLLTVTSFTDAQITSGGSTVLYTESRVSNDPAPPCRHVTSFQRRLVLSGCNDGQQVYWSQYVDQGFAPGFNVTTPQFLQNIPARYGRVVGTSEMDGKLAVIGTDQIGYVLGTGPDATGNGYYADIEMVVSDQGCQWDSPRSIGLGSDGVWFRSIKGIRCLGRDGNIKSNEHTGFQMGSEADSLLSGPVVFSAGDAKQLIRFYAGLSTCFLYDTQFNQWTCFNNHAATDAVYSQSLDRFYSAYQQVVRYYDSTLLTDCDDSGNTGQAVYAYVETAWLQFAGTQAFQRAYQMLALFTVPTGSAIDVQCMTLVGYDFGNVSTEAALQSIPVTPGATTTAQYRHKFFTQKCEALKIGFSFTSTTMRPRLTGMTLQIGVKSGPFPLPAVI